MLLLTESYAQALWNDCNGNLPSPLQEGTTLGAKLLNLQTCLPPANFCALFFPSLRIIANQNACRDDGKALPLPTEFIHKHS